MTTDGFLLGYDVGSSSMKATLLEVATGRVVAASMSPDRELPIDVPRPGWAEQHPDLWWEHIVKVTALLKQKAASQLENVSAIGISYQMHGLVLVDKNNQVLRPAIIWCDSRAVEIGRTAFETIGIERCLDRLLNSPGNFTASKLRWVRENEPEVYEKIHKFMLPGDYIAMRMTGTIAMTPSGLSEGILWDYRDNTPASLLLDYYDISRSLLPDIVPSFSPQGVLCAGAARELGLRTGIPVTYRGGDQPNNAFSLNVLNPGEIAATAGTSGVIYGVSEKPRYDTQSRVNTFIHLNYSEATPHYGILLCLNGTGILNSWLKNTLAVSGARPLDYDEMNRRAAAIPVGSGGLAFLPYGNGAERTLNNRNPGSSLHGLQFNLHTPAHLMRAAQEGIVFALNYGFSIMREIGVEAHTVRAGNANMFLSPLFCEAFATATQTTLQLYDTDGSQGAARGAGIGAGIYKDFKEAFSGLKTVRTIEPARADEAAYADAYRRWLNHLTHLLPGN